MSADFNPEDIDVALFELIKTAVAVQEIGFKLITRFPRLFSDIGIEQQPSLMLISQGGPFDQAQALGLSAATLHYMVLMYIFVEAEIEPAILPATIFNNCWAALVKALKPDAGGIGQQTLGGLVNNAWIAGDCLHGGIKQQYWGEFPIHVELGAS